MPCAEGQRPAPSQPVIGGGGVLKCGGKPTQRSGVAADTAQDACFRRREPGGKSARGLAHSKTCRTPRAHPIAKRLGVR